MPSAPDILKWLNASFEMGAVQRALENTNGAELNEVLLKLAAYQPSRSHKYFHIRTYSQYDFLLHIDDVTILTYSISQHLSQHTHTHTHTSNNNKSREIDVEEMEDSDAKNFISLAIYKVKDGWSHGSRTKLLKFFCEDRLSDLNTFSRVLVLHALQQLRVSASPM
jgi:hypothetical protein